MWEAVIPGFPETIMEVVGPGTVRYSAPEGQARSTIAVSLVSLPGGAILVQYAQPPVGAGSSEDIVEVTSAVFGARTGEVQSETSAWPRIDYVRGSLALARGNNPFPRVDIYRAHRRRP
jgi:hypothetical protein